MVQAAAPAPQPAAAPAPSPSPAPAAPSAGGGEKNLPLLIDDKYVAIKSPMIGTFYRTPNPDNPGFR